MADIPISDVTRRAVFTGSAGTGPYACTFEILANTDIAVYFTRSGTTSLCTLTTDYTVSIAGNGTFTVTLVTGSTVLTTPTASDTVSIVGAKAIARTSDYQTGGDFFASTINTDLDNQTIFSQQLSERVDRSLKGPVSDVTSLDMTLPAASSRASGYLAFNASGEPIAATALDTSTSFTNALSGASARTWTEKVSETVSPEDFGATGDGTTDDASSIQAAVDALDAAGGGIIKGKRSQTYAIKAPITIPYTVGLEDMSIKAVSGYTEQDDPLIGTHANYGKRGMVHFYDSAAGTGNANIALRNVWIDGNGLADTGLKDYVSVGRKFDTVRVTSCTAYNVRLIGTQNCLFELLNTTAPSGGVCLCLDTAASSNVFVRSEININSDTATAGILSQASLPALAGIGSRPDNTFYYPLVERDRLATEALVKITGGYVRIRGGNLSTSSGTSSDQAHYKCDKDNSVIAGILLLLQLDGVSHVSDGGAGTVYFNIVDTCEVALTRCSFSGNTQYLANIDDNSHIYDAGGNSFASFTSAYLNTTGALTGLNLMAPGKTSRSRYDWEGWGSADYGYRCLVTGESFARTALRGDGKFVFGGGSSTYDSALGWIAANHIGTDSGDSFRIGGSLTQPVNTLTSTSGAITLQYGFNAITLTENITSMTFPTAIEGAELTILFLQAASGGPYTVAFPAGSALIAGGSYTMTSTASKRDVLVFKWWVNRWVEISRSQNM